LTRLHCLVEIFYKQKQQMLDSFIHHHIPQSHVCNAKGKLVSDNLCPSYWSPCADPLPQCVCS